jgi:ubiquinone/menaquinone biosynthesis C-methylase UbiE
MKRSVWLRLVARGFRLLYSEMAWLYDPVSYVVSLGRWRRWQQTALAFVPAQADVLEVGAGPGHILSDVAAAGSSPTPGSRGRQPVGLDLSPHMLRLAHGRLRRHGVGAGLVRGQANALPFAACTFDAMVTTFPTPFVYDPAWIRQLARVLKPGGRLVVVETAVFTRRDIVARFVEWLYRLTGERGPFPDLPGLLGEAGLPARRESVPVDGSLVGLVIGDRPK